MTAKRESIQKRIDKKREELHQLQGKKKQVYTYVRVSKTNTALIDKMVEQLERLYQKEMIAMNIKRLSRDDVITDLLVSALALSKDTVDQESVTLKSMIERTCTELDQNEKLE